MKREWERFAGELGQLTDGDKNQVASITNSYIDETLKQIDTRFPEPKFLTCFMIFDPVQVPQDRQQRKNYGNEELQQLLNRYGARIQPALVGIIS